MPVEIITLCLWIPLFCFQTITTSVCRHTMLVLAVVEIHEPEMTCRADKNRGRLINSIHSDATKLREVFRDIHDCQKTTVHWHTPLIRTFTYVVTLK